MEIAIQNENTAFFSIFKLLTKTFVIKTHLGNVVNDHFNSYPLEDNVQLTIPPEIPLASTVSQYSVPA